MYLGIQIDQNKYSIVECRIRIRQALLQQQPHCCVRDGGRINGINNECVCRENLFHLLAFIRITIRHTGKYVYVSTYVCRQQQHMQYSNVCKIHTTTYFAQQNVSISQQTIQCCYKTFAFNFKRALLCCGGIFCDFKCSQLPPVFKKGLILINSKFSTSMYVDATQLTM